MKNTPKIIYISGPMTGLPDLNFPAFHEAAKNLRAAGYQVVNPAEKNEEGDPSMAWLDYMRLDIKMLMDCDGIATLPGCEKSKGANVEIGIMVGLGLPVNPLYWWLEKKGWTITWVEAA
jgi:nucleoside 2-deoxyribosyltransferase